MTDVFLFWLDTLSKIFQASLDCKFEFFGVNVSFLELILGMLVLLTSLNFLRFSLNSDVSLVSSSRRLENVREKKRERKRSVK